MSLKERQNLLAYWRSDMFDRLQNGILTALQTFNETKEKFLTVRDEPDLRTLEECNVVGLTTSGLARNLPLIRRLNAKVLLCEEAAEVLESHLLTSLTPSIEHFIGIGDHKQLRPQVHSYDLSVESKQGEQYALDVSLFERLVTPSASSEAGIPFNTLRTQYRMHPLISRLIHCTLYPDILDADRVSEHPPVAGMKKRLFWMDHDHQEDSALDLTGSTSRSNSFEVEMCVLLIKHLIRQGIYQTGRDNGEIVVLTPYLKQLLMLRQALGAQSELVMEDRDVEELGDIESADGPSQPTVVRAKLSQSVRIATIDNFQGSEASVVILSLVRCNREKKVGFLRTTNRINVGLSRAKHGMYIFGSASTAASVPMWQDVLELLAENNNVGPRLELERPRHSNSPIEVSSPDDFHRLSPEGGCSAPCDKNFASKS
ncbi:hypothetical protein LTS18_003615 [Coniosporium uncinatum]|uniref:Uncharacterized protein n=1 Tax=Coniosporium uncinatum TaxID=93489 RepID=A0ACC3D6Y4_9PEZI|nr:hypothetical protein LTS18_003615 [Coniosporium uncinatum]